MNTPKKNPLVCILPSQGTSHLNFMITRWIVYELWITDFGRTDKGDFNNLFHQSGASLFSI